jgi:hypothetical protein
VPAVIEMVNVGLRSYFIAPASELKITKPVEVQEAIVGFRVSKTTGPNCISNRALKHLPQRVISVQVLIFNAILLTYHFPTAWKHDRMISVLKSGQDQHCHHHIGPLFFMTRLVNYLKDSIG